MSGHRIFPHCFLAPVTYYSGNTQIIHPFKYFDRIGASPPCTEYSIGMQAGVRKIEQAEIVMRTLEAIRYDIYFKPVWFIETDQTGLLPLRHTLWIIASMDFLTGEGQDFGQTWTLRHLDHCVKSTYRMMDGNRYKEIGIYLKKMHKEHLVIANTLGLKTTPCSNKRIFIEFLNHQCKNL